jgi:hypothetical protein
MSSSVKKTTQHLTYLLLPINGIGVGFAKDDIRFAWVYSLLGSSDLDNTAIDLSAIASGTGGFVINGENVSSVGFTEDNIRLTCV